MNETTGNDGKGQKQQAKRRQIGSESGRRTNLFLRVRNGELDLFGALIDELAGLLRRRLRFNSRTRTLAFNPADVEDVLQETFLRLWKHRARFDSSRGTIEGWAWIIARNTAVSVLRLRSRTSTTTHLLDAVEDRRAAKRDSGLLAAEEREAFLEALERVRNEKVRRALKLRLVSGLPYAAVSKETGVPLGTLAGWVHKLRRSLREEALRAA